jgi:hypothetical protein
MFKDYKYPDIEQCVEIYNDSKKEKREKRWNIMCDFILKVC